jgi:D-alanyl-D-alanine carboxypeptidase (penicillin-binding protein 5/6)
MITSRRALIPLLFLLVARPVLADEAPKLNTVPAGLQPPPPMVAGESAILVETSTATVLYAKNADLVIPPASLTKLVAIHVVMEAVAAGETSLTEIVRVPPFAAASAMPPDSSLMFLDTGQTVSLEDLLLGLVVSSGNDASVAVATHIAGSVSAFVERMNESVGRMGLTTTTFADASGLSPMNRTTAREFARFLLVHLNRFPELRQRLYSVVDFAYPKAENLVPGTTNPTIIQRNRNLLVGSDPRVDGLKTGFIDESGYNIAVSAGSDGLEVVAIVLGVAADNHAAGGRLRAEAARALLDYGFSSYDMVELSPPPVEPTRIWEGTRTEITAVGAPASLVVPSHVLDQLDGRVFQVREVTAPIARGENLGRVAYLIGESEYHSVPLVAPDAVPAAGFPVRLWHRVMRMVTTGRSGP